MYVQPALTLEIFSRYLRIYSDHFPKELELGGACHGETVCCV
jgi:hypothetical protein